MIGRATFRPSHPSSAAPRTPEDLLRASIVATVAAVKAYDVPRLCTEVGLQADVGADDEQQAYTSKARYVAERVDRLDRAALLDVADRLQTRRPGFELEETLRRVREGRPTVTELTRRAVLDHLNASVGLEQLSGRLGLVTFLERVWPLAAMPSDDSRCADAAADISQHTENNNDWDFDYLLKRRLGLLDASDHTFLRFLEEVVHPIVRSADQQQELATLINDHLRPDAWRLEATDTLSGQPVYRAVRAGGPAHAVKNLIFASTGPKPDLVLANAITNEIRIVRHAEHCLVYDRPIPAEGLRWRDLVRWWADRVGEPADAVATEHGLYRRLEASLDEGVERPFFYRYFKAFRSRLAERLPALIPQVYLHYDPKTVRERARLATTGTAGPEDGAPLTRQRMDFLLLLPGHVRVVLELDGQQHYAESLAAGAAASPSRYADMVGADRDLRLGGYEVYRFGGYELQPGRLEGVVDTFFGRLLARHGLG